MAPRDLSDEPRLPHSARSLLGRNVRIGDAIVGRVTDVLLNRSIGHALGFVLEGRGGQLLFLPWVAARFEGGDLAPISVFALLSASELSFYLENGVRLTLALDGPGADGNPLDEVFIGRDGDVVVAVPGRSAAAPFAARTTG